MQVYGLGFRVAGLGFRVWGLGFKNGVQDFGFWGSGFRVGGLGEGHLALCETMGPFRTLEMRRDD